MVSMSPVHYCPSCGLAFRNKPELEYHWSEEHDPALQPSALQDPVVPDGEETEKREPGS